MSRTRAEAAVAVAAFAALCAAVLLTAPFLVEPDDYAYRASIVAMTQGHFLTLSAAQVHALAMALGGGHWGSGRFGMPAIAQWVRLSDGRWISEKDPGYPFLAAPFQALGIIRLAPLCYGALACTGLFFGARRWLGRWGGTAAVGLYCSSGAALLFAWRDYMPTFTDASLIAAGTGALLWAVLASEATLQRRTWVGLAAFVALEAAVFARYTNIVVLACAVVAVVAAWRVRTARLPGSALAWWLGSVAVFGAAVALFNDLVYGGPFKSGYQPGEIVFSLRAVLPNLRYMPARLIQAMPMLVLGLAALVWIAARWLRRRRDADGLGAETLRDLAVGLALAGSWAGVWGLYAAYTWTAMADGGILQTARFYVPAMGAISMLGAWLLVRLPGLVHLPGPARSVPGAARRLPRLAQPPGTTRLAAGTSALALVALFGLGMVSFHSMLTMPRGMVKVGHACGGQRPITQRPIAQRTGTRLMPVHGCPKPP
jgi:hypothetical protein